MLVLPESYTISGSINWQFTLMMKRLFLCQYKCMALYTSVKKILKEMCEQGGRDTERDLFGQKGKYITQLSKNTLLEPCIKCGHEIRKANFLGGAVYYCENCQKKSNVPHQYEE